MIKYFSVENFRSIKSESILEFDVGSDKYSHFIANPIIGVAGANASGKTTVLQALTFTLWFMQRSFLKIEQDETIPIEPFSSRSLESSRFHIIFAAKTIVDGTSKYVDYDYRVILTKHKVLEEELYYYPYGRKRKVYLRTNNDVVMGDTIPIPTNDKKTFLKDLRTNCSIVSYAAQFSSQEVAITCQNYKFHSNVTYSGLREVEFNPALAEDLIKDEESRTKTLELLQLADTGIQDLSLNTLSGTDIEEAIKIIKELDPDRKKRIPPIILEKLENDINNPDFQMKQITFKHLIDEELVDFDPNKESSGTKKFIAIFGEVFGALKDGSLLVIDEIELKLHQNLVAYLIGLFENPYENKHGAQLIFSFHNTAFMRILSPNQLWFTEKNEGGHTEVFSAADFKDIKNIQERDLETLYRIGRFGAKPRGI